MNCVSLLVILSALCMYLQQQNGAEAEMSCSKNCKPLETIHCDQDTGECAEGCNTGYYGITCDIPCQCGGRSCEFRDGTCTDVSTVSDGCVCNAKEGFDQVFPVVICCLCLLAFLTIFAICYGKEKILTMCKKEDKPRPEHGEEHKLMNNSDQNQLETSDASAITLSRQVPASPKPDSSCEKLSHDQRRVLEDKLGVHFLNPDDPDPIVLFCALMKFDHKRVNREKTHLNRDYILFNKPASSKKESPERFKEFYGTTSIAPVIPVDSPSYWEVNTHVCLNNELGEADLLLSIGLCSETQRDTHHQVRLDDHCFNLNVGLYDGRICKKIYREKDREGIIYETNMANKMGESRNLHYAVLVYRGKGAILYFDIDKMECIACLDEVNFKKIDLEGPLWPMFGVYNGDKATVKMNLKTGRYVDMPEIKKKMILSAVQAVKS